VDINRRSILKGAGGFLGGGSLIAGGFADEVVSASQVNSPLKEVQKKNKGGSTDWSKEGLDAIIGESFYKDFSTLNITQIDLSAQAWDNWGIQSVDGSNHPALSDNATHIMTDPPTTTIIGEDVDDNEPPIPDLVAGSSTTTVGSSVSFTHQSYDPDGTLNKVGWSFGDGSVSKKGSPTHSWDSTGNYDVTLIVADDDGAVASTSTTITVEANEGGGGGGGGENSAPTATADSSTTTATTGESITFDGSGSSDSDGSISSYEWTFGDGATASGSQVTHTYTTAGEYDATLTVTDDDGATSSAVETVTVESSDGGGGGGGSCPPNGVICPADEDS
jgi:PKD repeat protein